MVSETFSFTESDYSAEIKNNTVTTSFDKETGVVSVKFQIRNPRIENAAILLSHKLSGEGTFTDITKYSLNGVTDSLDFGVFSQYKEMHLQWSAWEDLTLSNHTGATLKLQIWDDASSKVDSNRVYFKDDIALDIDLEPKVTEVIHPHDFGEGGSTEFIFRCPALKRSQKIVPQLRISTSSDMSNPTPINSCAFTVSSVNTISGFASTNGGAATVVSYAYKQGNTIATNDTVSISGTENYDGTYTITNVADSTGTISKAFSVNETVGLLLASNQDTYGSYGTSGQNVNIDSGIQLKFKFSVTVAASIYFDVALNCEEIP